MIYEKEKSFHHVPDFIKEELDSCVKMKSLSLHECRICLQNSVESDKEMRCVCSCQGSVKYVHLECLKEWILCTIKNKKEEEIQEMEENGLKCELCKVPIFF